MPTPKLVCGAECGLATVGTLSAGTEHWSAAGAGVSVSATNARNGGSAFLFFQLAADVVDFLEHTFTTAIASSGTMVARFYWRCNGQVDGTRTIFSTPDGLSGLRMVTGFGVTVLEAWAGNATTVAGTNSGPLQTNKWYLIDITITRGTTITVDWKLDEVSQGQATKAAQTAVTIPGFRIGSNPNGTGANASSASNWQVDDIYISETGADYPISHGAVIGLYPTGDRTNSSANPTDGNGGHLFSATNDFGKGSGGATVTGAQNAEATSWQSLANPLSASIATNFIADINGAATERLVWTHTTMPTTAVSISGVMLVIASHSQTATTNNCTVSISDASNNVVAGINAALSVATITTPVAIIANAPGGAAWTAALLNSSFFRFLSSDVTPDVYLDGACLEVDYKYILTSKIVQANQSIVKSSVW